MTVNRYRSNPNETQEERIARLRRQEQERKERQLELERQEELERKIQEHQDRLDLEEERLAELASVQPDPDLFWGDAKTNFDSFGYNSSGLAPYLTGTAARPPHSWDYETDTPAIRYWDYFGEPSLADIAKFKKEFDALLASNKWTPNERQQIEEKWQSFLDGDVDPWSLEVQGMYARFNISQREEWADDLEEYGVENYASRATTLAEAKEHADEVYMEVLQNAYDENPTDALAKAIEQGPLDFDKAEDVELYNSLSENSIQRQAFDAQGAVVENFLNLAEGDAFDSESLEQGQTFSWGFEGKAGTTLLNTGTIVGAPDVTRDNVTFGEFGTHGSYSYDNPPKPNDFEKALNFTFDVLSIIYPHLAPVFQGIKTTITTGDIEEGLEAAGKVYVGGEIVKGVTEGLNTQLAESGVEIPTGEVDPTTGVAQTTTLGEVFSSLPEQVQNITTNTIGGVVSGQSGEEAFTGAIKGELANVAVDSAIEGLDIDEDKLVANVKETLGLDPDFELPAPIQNIVNDTTDAWVAGDSASDAFDSSVESEIEDYVGGVAEDVIKEGAGILADALPDVDFETPQIVKDIGDAAVDLLEGPVELIGNVLEPVGEVVEAGADVVQQVTEPVVDLVDEGLDYIGEEYVDPALQALDEALPHGETPEGPDVDGPDIDVELVMPERTPTENLFGDEIGKIYRTPIETYKPAFSQQEIQGMLSQRFRG
jgi:hypothetical protein